MGRAHGFNLLPRKPLPVYLLNKLRYLVKNAPDFRVAIPVGKDGEEIRGGGVDDGHVVEGATELWEPARLAGDGVVCCDEFETVAK